MGPLGCLPDLLLAGMVGRHSEGHELIQRHAVVGVDLEQLVPDGGKPKPLLHDVYRDEKGGGDVLLGLALFT